MTEEEAYQNRQPPEQRRTDSRSVAARIDELYRRIRPGVDYGAIAAAGGGGVLFKLSSNATGSGFYNGNYWTPPASAPAGTATLTEAMMGTIGAAVLVANLAEITKTTHIIKFSGSPTPYQFIFPGIVVTCGDGSTYGAIYVAQFGCT